MESDRQEILRFGEFEIRPQAGRLMRDGQPIALEPRSFDLLLLLARSGGRLVAKEEILGAVWNGAIVTDNALTRAVARLRRALGDSAKKPRFIETAHSRGYRFLSRVVTVYEESDYGALPGDRGFPTGVDVRTVAVAVTLMLLAVAVPIVWKISGAAPAPDDSTAGNLDLRRVAVLPLVNLSGGAEDEYFVDGLTEQIISNLAQVDGLRVLARTTTSAYENYPGRIAGIASELGAGSVLEGSARRSGDRLRIHVQLIDGASEEHLWTGEFERSVADMFTIQSEIATRVAEALTLSISDALADRLLRGPTRDLGAYDAYLRGRQAYRKQTQLGNEEAIVFFKKALEVDPDFAFAEAGLANAYALRTVKFGFDVESEELAIGAAQRALALNPELPEAHKALGIIAFRRDRIQEAIDWSRKALEFNPSYGEAVYNLSSFLYIAGRWDEALRIQLRETRTPHNVAGLAQQMLALGLQEPGRALAEKALNSEPFSVYVSAELARIDVLEGRVELARSRAAGLCRAHPEWPGSWETAAQVELLAGKYDEAAEFFETAHSVRGGSAETLLDLGRIRWLLGDRRAAEAAFEKVSKELEPLISQGSQYWIHYWMMAAIEAMRGNGDQAAEWYRVAVDMGHRRGDLDEADPTFSNVLQHPGFRGQLERMRELIDRMRDSVAAEAELAAGRLLAS